jgi:hypothetical protein
MYRDWKKCIHDFGGEMKERDHLENLSVYGRIILQKWDGRPWTVLMWSIMGKSCA